MISLGKSINENDTNTSGGQDKNNMPQKQTVPSPKGKETHEESGYQKAFQKISNDLIELNKLFAGNPPATKAFRPYKKYNKPQPQQLALSLPPI